jgi:hypothetical protein
VAAIRRRWFRPGYWGWRWRSDVSREAKLVSALIGLGAVAVAGYLAADTLGGSTSTSASYETTVEKVVTVRERGRTVRKPVRVVQQVLVTTSSASDGTQVVTRRIVSTVPVIRRQVVTEAGRARTVVETQTQTRTRAVTDRQTVTDSQTVTDEQLVTVTRPVTITQTSTVVRTVPTTVTETESVTVTVPTTVTVSLPGDD